MKPFLPVIASAMGAAAFGINTGQVAPVTNPPFRQSGLDAHDGSASASLLGQFRTNVSAWLWVHTDLYLHNGVQMRPVTDAERKQGIQVEKASPDGNRQLLKEVSITLVPSPERDFRGVLGDVDRAVSPWKPMQGHQHNDPMQTLPLFRLMTWCDPQFIEGWTTGATVLSWNRSSVGNAKALEFLRQGLSENPDNVDLLTEIGSLQITWKRDFSDAIPVLERAREVGYNHLNTLADNERDALENAYRWLALAYRETRRPKEMRRVAQEGLTAFADDRPLQSLLGPNMGKP